LNGPINTIRLPLGMARNPTYNKYVLVFGRRREYGANEARRMLIKSQESDDFKIITYDSLVENLKYKHDLFVGVRLNTHVKLLSDTLIDESLFSWMDPTQISVNAALHAAIVAATPSNARINDGTGKFVEALAHVAPLLRRHS
jgi:hypothetical protein